MPDIWVDVIGTALGTILGAVIAGAVQIYRDCKARRSENKCGVRE